MSTRHAFNPGSAPRRALTLVTAAAGVLLLAGCQTPVVTEPPTPVETEDAGTNDAATGDTGTDSSGTNNTDDPSDTDVFDPDGSINGATSVAETFFTAVDAFTAIGRTHATMRFDVEPLDSEIWAFPTLFISIDSAAEMTIVYRTVTYWAQQRSRGPALTNLTRPRLRGKARLGAPPFAQLSDDGCRSQLPLVDVHRNE